MKACFSIPEEKKKPKTEQSDFHCDDCARMETATLPNLSQGDDKRQ